MATETKERLYAACPSAAVRLAPWALSVAFHATVALVAMAAAIVVVDRGYHRDSTPSESILSAQVAPAVETSGDASPLDSPEQFAASSAAPAREYARAESPVLAGVAESPKITELTSPAGIGAAASLSRTDAAAEAIARAPSSMFMGAGGFAHHVIYVIDRSGSMIANFDDIRREALLSIGRLKESQDFHVILFADSRAIELGSGKLLLPTQGNKIKAAEFLASAKAAQGSDPIPALRKAFDSLDKASAAPGKLIYLLTDGDFPDNEKVLAMIRQRNKDGTVHINTYFYGDPGDLTSRNTLRRIALDNGGVFKSLTEKADNRKAALGMEGMEP